MDLREIGWEGVDGMYLAQESSLPCSQEPITGPYAEPGESSPHLPTLYP